MVADSDSTTPAVATVGGTDLRAVLASLRAVRIPGRFAFCTVPDACRAALQAIDREDVAMECKEPRDRATTVVLREELVNKGGKYAHLFHDAETGEPHDASATDLPTTNWGFPLAWIQLDVHSSLALVGLTAAVSRALADAGISANVVAAFFHDHLFVAASDADRALEVLNQVGGE